MDKLTIMLKKQPLEMTFGQILKRIEGFRNTESFMEAIIQHIAHFRIDSSVWKVAESLMNQMSRERDEEKLSSSQFVAVPRNQADLNAIELKKLRRDADNRTATVNNVKIVLKKMLKKGEKSLGKKLKAHKDDG